MTFEITILKPSWHGVPRKQIVHAEHKQEAMRHPLRVKGSRVVHVVPCHGEAHSNAFIDNCMLCAPRWGWLAVRGPAKVKP